MSKPIDSRPVGSVLFQGLSPGPRLNFQLWRRSRRSKSVRSNVARGSVKEISLIQRVGGPVTKSREIASRIDAPHATKKAFGMGPVSEACLMRSERPWRQ